jgi:DNA (cytosine-5)-methyltransferase 1
MNENKEIKYIDLFGGIGGFRLGLEKASKEQNKESWANCSNTNRELSTQGRSKPTTNYEKTERCKGTKQENESKMDKGDLSNFNGRELSHTFSNTTFRCVWYCDNDKYAVQTYNKNFKENHKPKDITKIDTRTIPRFDMLCAGFPCQAFSIAGKRRGFQDTRGTLFFQIARIIEAKRPSYLFLENVKGLLNHDKGKTFTIILQTLDELGYDCQWMVFNSKFFGVPQNRERVFIIGNIRGTSRTEILPFRETDSNYVETLKYEGAIMSEQNQKWLEDGKEISHNFPQGQRVYSSDGIASSICGNAGGLGGKTGLYLINSNIDKKINEPKYVLIDLQTFLRGGEWGDGIHKDTSGTLHSSSGRDFIICENNKIKKIFDKGHEAHHLYDSNGLAPTVREMHGKVTKIYDKQDKEQKESNIVVHSLQPHSPDRPSLKYSSGGSGHLQRDDGNSYCLDSGNSQAIESTGLIRRLTPVECERLQGFPDNWTSGVSDTQRYKQLGNAVTVNVIEAIGKQFIESIENDYISNKEIKIEQVKNIEEWLS